MAYQLLQGIQVTPKGNYNLGRFGSTMINGSWPQSFAFGGWIYNAECEIGYSEQPTEIKLSIVLEVANQTESYQFFNIQDSDLKIDAGNGGDENLYDINFNGIIFQDMVLYEKQIEIQNKNKILTVTFKDYSVILDKIYVGLLKRQGAQYVYTANCTLSFNVNCQDCQLNGSSLILMGYAIRPMSHGSYVGTNGQIYDNFANINDTENVWLNWQQLFNFQPSNTQFDLNGGYLILGTEEATQNQCGDLATVSYNFNELLASLRYRGLQFVGAFPVAQTDADYIYHQTYVGSLREVLSQWCSDLGYSFYCQGKQFVGINLDSAIDISQIVNIADPTTLLGSQFSLNKNSAILSYKQTTSLANTFTQAVITNNNRPRNAISDTKTPMIYVGYLPLHPIDFNRHSNTPLIRYNAYGDWFWDIAWANNFEPGSPDRNLVLPELDGRTYGDIDTAICLSHYDITLRDLFCQDKAIHALAPDGNYTGLDISSFKALGMVPLIELQDEAKAMAIESMVPQGNFGGDKGDEVSNLCLDKRFYRVFLGYYYNDFKEEVVQWEQDGAESMYKWGIITNGVLSHYPYLPQNILVDESPQSGFYGENGTSLLRISNHVQPDAQQYYVMRQAPFKDLILYSGLMTPFSESIPIPLSATGLFPTGLWYGSLINDWGTLPEEFKRIMSLNLDDPCIDQFSNSPSYTQIVNNIPTKFQDWRLENFRPQVSPDIEKVYQLAATQLANLGSITDFDKTVSGYYDLHYKQRLQCSKLHLMVLTDTRYHPNIYLQFTPQGTQFNNWVMLQGYLDRERVAAAARANMETPNICSQTLLQEMCLNVLSGRFLQSSGDPRYGCILTENKYNYFIEGFPYSVLTSANSRGLNVQIVKNPIRNNDADLLQQTFTQTDINGDFYYADVTSNLLSYNSAQLNYTIVYPVSLGQTASYNGILTSDFDLENRTPEIVEIYGNPVNITNNPTATFKIINNVVDPDIQPQLDPYAQRFIPYMTIITGADAQAIMTVEAYHNFLVNLNSYELLKPMKSVDLTLAGTPNTFGTFVNYLSPNYGLNKISMSVNDDGVITSLSFADRPKILPKQESIVNKVLARYADALSTNRTIVNNS